jgi:hypothetical protein
MGKSDNANVSGQGRTPAAQHKLLEHDIHFSSIASARMHMHVHLSCQSMLNYRFVI